MHFFIFKKFSTSYTYPTLSAIYVHVFSIRGILSDHQINVQQIMDEVLERIHYHPLKYYRFISKIKLLG